MKNSNLKNQITWYCYDVYGFDDNKSKCCCCPKQVHSTVLNCLVNNVQEQVLRTGTEDKLADKTFQNFRTTLRTALRSVWNNKLRRLVDSTRVLGLLWFHFIRFLLICQLESLDLSLTWNDFAFLKIFWITFQNSPENRAARVFPD